MLLAIAGTAMLFVVAITSVRAARRRLRYESWHLLHLYAYLGVGLAIPDRVGGVGPAAGCPPPLPDRAAGRGWSVDSGGYPSDDVALRQLAPGIARHHVFI